MKRSRRSIRRPLTDDDAMTNPLYAVRVRPNGTLDHSVAVKAADEAAREAAERRAA